MSHHDENREQFKAARDAGLKARHARRLKRWEGIDSWLARWEEAEDPHGVYGNCGRKPENIIGKADAA